MAHLARHTCSSIGTLNLATGECSCPITHSGRFCEVSRLPACSLLPRPTTGLHPRGLPVDHALRPLFWVATVTRLRDGRIGREAPKSAGGMGPLPCACARQLLELAAPFRSKWSLLPPTLVCATSTRSDFTLGDLLVLGGLHENISWVSMSASFDDQRKAYRFSEAPLSPCPRPPCQHGPTASGASAQELAMADFGGTLLRNDKCSRRCMFMGWCFARLSSRNESKVHHPTCRCFPEALRSRPHPSLPQPPHLLACDRVAVAMAVGANGRPRNVSSNARAGEWSADGVFLGWGEPSGGTLGGERSTRTALGVKVGEAMLGYAEGGGPVPNMAPMARGLKLIEASSSSVAFNYMRCPLDCSGAGKCDLHGFCSCRHGYFGLDCGIQMCRSRQPAPRESGGAMGRRGHPAERRGSKLAGVRGWASRLVPCAWRYAEVDPRKSELSAPGPDWWNSGWKGEESESDEQRDAREAMAYDYEPMERPSPRIYVYDLEVRYRVGPQLLSEFEAAIAERVISSPYREADPSRADYFWMPGPNLGAAAKLEHVREAYPYWAESTRRGLGARHILSLLTERGAGDTDLAQRTGRGDEIDPANPHRPWLALTLNGMEDSRATKPAAAADAATGAAGGGAGGGAGAGGGEGVGGGPRKPCHVCFVPKVDIVIPPPTASIDVPSCAELREAVGSRELSPTAARPNTFFWAGRVSPNAHRGHNPMYAATRSVREMLVQSLTGADGFKVVNTYGGAHSRGGESARLEPSARVEPEGWMANSSFCWVPPGQRYGDARRHILATFLGCIPVFTVPDGHHTLEEVLPWGRMSLDVPPPSISRLPAELDAVAERQRARMRTRLGCARRYLWWGSVYGACLEDLARHPPGAPRADGPPPDAFEALMAVLALRLEGEAGGRRAATIKQRVPMCD